MTTEESSNTQSAPQMGQAELSAPGLPPTGQSRSDGAAVILESGALQWAGPGRRWHQSVKTRQADARREAPAPAIELQYEARVHHGPQRAGRRSAGARSVDLFCCAADHAYYFTQIK
jgi:hypothetical protein